MLSCTPTALIESFWLSVEIVSFSALRGTRDEVELRIMAGTIAVDVQAGKLVATCAVQRISGLLSCAIADHSSRLAGRKPFGRNSARSGQSGVIGLPVMLSRRSIATDNAVERVGTAGAGKLQAGFGLGNLGYRTLAALASPFGQLALRADRRQISASVSASLSIARTRPRNRPPRA
jgi:hypothetical protein